ncbi:hypothetical protein BKA63DRAFT_457555 [Paraphoma chrysanthemicola]|nr:hypothetical protein BKA63DRAFT_457555 [Paraphoma chrysanthemicola]
MAIPWPHRATWPTPLREHAANLSTFAHEVLHLMERNATQPVPADVVGDIIRGSLTFVLKVQHTPDLSALSDALRIAQTEAKINAENTAQALGEIKNEVMNTKEITQRSAVNAQQNEDKIKEVGVAVREATEVGRNIMEMTRDIKNRRIQEQAIGQVSYAAAAARNLPQAGTYNTQVPKTPSAQIQREVIVHIRDPLTVQSLRAMNPGNLKAHVERAIEQSANENIMHVKIVSANQLKSGDLSIKTAASNEVEALRQFTEDWTHRIGTGATVRIPTYGVLAHGVRTSSMDMTRFEENRAQILQDNRPFIPQAEIKHIGWLTRDASAKPASTITIEFTRPEDANKIIDEGLIWQGECKATTACGYCAQEHDTRNCPGRMDREMPRKCATCRGDHEAWSRQCPTRKDEILKAKIAYEMRPRYHPVTQPGQSRTQPEALIPARRNVSNQSTAATQFIQVRRNGSRPGRGQKRTNNGTTVEPGGQENRPPVGTGSQRPQRNIVPSRRALESISGNVQTIQETTQHMEIDLDTEA